MTRRQTPRGRNGSAKAGGIEWVGGTVSMPAYVSGEDKPYRPEVLIWMGAEGAILGSTLAKPGELLARASASLQSTIEQPMYGRAHRPARVRVASAELADALRAGHPGLEVVCAPTPELDEAIALLRERFGEDDGIEQSYLSPGLTPEAMASFFRAAAVLFGAKPWKFVPDDESLFSVTIEQLGVRGQAMSVIGQAGESHGFILFSDLDDFDAYLDAAAAVEHGEEPALPPHFALSFERGAELAPELRKEIAEHGWEVAGPNAYPWLVAVDEDLVARPPTGEEVAMAEAIARALVAVMAERKVLRAAWGGGEPVSRTLSVATHAGEIEITLRAPYPRTPVEFDPSRDLLADLAALTRGDDEIDDEARGSLESELMRRFAASPEGKDFEEILACGFVMDLAAHYLGQTIATLGASELREVLFDLVPRKVSIEAAEAGRIVEEVRAFYRFLERDFGLAQAGACLRVLGGTAAAKLEAALADTGKFGMAKSLIMAGADAGYDMHSEEGLAAWMRSIEGRALPPSIPIPGLGAPRPAGRKSAKAKKDKRKAARKARKKQR